MTEEYKTLNQWFDHVVRGDGRRFVPQGWKNSDWFEPIYMDSSCDWHGLNNDEDSCSFFESDALFKEYKDPKKTVKMYQPVLDGFDDSIMLSIFKTKEECKHHVKVSSTKKLLGYITHEVELE